MATNNYTGLNPRTQAWVVTQLLENSLPYMNIHNMMGQDEKALPTKTGDQVKFRRYLPFTVNKTPLTDGTSNLSGATAENYQPLNFEDFMVQVQEYGIWTSLSEKAELMVEDDILGETVRLFGENLGQVSESLSWDVLSAATVVFTTENVATPSLVKAPFNINDLRSVERFLLNNSVSKISTMLTASVGIATEPVAAAYWGLCHPDLIKDFRNLNASAVGKSDDFIPVEKYSTQGNVMPSEFGKVESIRMVQSPLYTPVKGGGAVIAGTPTVKTTTVGADKKADIYNIVIFGKHAYQTLALKGHESAEVLVADRKPSAVDPYAHIRSIAGKIWQATLITNPRNICRLVTASAV